MPTEQEAYVSPLLSRLKDEEEITLKTLAKYVPLVQTGNAAAEELKTTPATDTATRRQLHAQIHAGERAKEKLVLISLPLVKKLAYKEYRRRQAWSSRVPLEEIVQEGLGGFLKGIQAYNVNGSHDSATNYIGQWIMTDIRRNVEALEHDFAVPYETIERHRKIRAIRSRLTNEMGREPTDEEIVQAAIDSSGSYGDTKLGKVDKTRNEDPKKPDRRRVITLKHLEEERDFARRTGAVKTTSVDTDDDNNGAAEVASASVINTEDNATAVETVDALSAQNALRSLLEASFGALSIGSTQQDLIRRKFGLLPYTKEQTLKDICLETKIPRHKVNKILISFSQEMSRKGGPFHALVSRVNDDDLDSMGMGWLVDLLGPWQGAEKGYSPSPDLTMHVRGGTVNRQPPRPAARKNLTTATGRGVVAEFSCPTHSAPFTRVYEDEDSVPATLNCPYCSKKSQRLLN